jgi:tRNA G18 (ribose-2'-O)-methylase SpoU
MQLTHDKTFFFKNKFPIILICDNVNNAPNIGSLFRISDAFGVRKIIFTGENLIEIPSRKILKTSRATEKYVDFENIKNINEYLHTIKESHEIIAVEITEKSKQLSTYKFNFNKPIALIIGDENFGVSEKVLNNCSDTIHINMYGKNSSMNVVQATNIVLYEITKQLQDGSR